MCEIALLVKKLEAPERGEGSGIVEFSPQEVALYEVEPPLNGFRYIVASSVDHSFAKETYLFGANASGEIVDWTDLPGSMCGKVPHSVALLVTGYTLLGDTDA